MTTIITGASRGIGRAIADHDFFKDKRRVLISKGNSLKINELANQNTRLLCQDVGEPETAKTAVQFANQLGEPVDTLICSAGIGKSGPTEDFSLDEWHNIMRTNIDGCFNFIREVLPDMLTAKHGTIILISSIAGIHGYGRNAAYTASKHAIVGLAKSIAKEHAKRGIVCVPICPSFVDTDMTDRTINGLVRHRGLDPDGARDLVASKNPQNRIIPASEIAEMVAFICSGKCPSLNGNPIILSGGE